MSKVTQVVSLGLGSEPSLHLIHDSGIWGQGDEGQIPVGHQILGPKTGPFSNLGLSLLWASVFPMCRVMRTTVSDAP